MKEAEAPDVQLLLISYVVSALRVLRRVRRKASVPGLTFDLVTCQTVLINVADARAVLIEMLRVVKPDGIVVAAEPNNLVNMLGAETSELMTPFEETLRRLRFEGSVTAARSRWAY